MNAKQSSCSRIQECIMTSRWRPVLECTVCAEMKHGFLWLLETGEVVVQVELKWSLEKGMMTK